jgi:hypothetical protein
MMPKKTSAGKNEVLRLGAMRLPPPLRTKWQSKAAIDAPPQQTDLQPSPINLLPHDFNFHKGGRSPDAKPEPPKKDASPQAPISAPTSICEREVAAGARMLRKTGVAV